jgi:hypothetical protein
METEAAVRNAMLHIVRPCIPTPALNAHMAGSGEDCAFHCRFTESGQYASAFKAGKAAFVASTLDTLPQPTAQPLSHPQLTVKGAEVGARCPRYMSRAYTTVEVDCLLKVPAPADPLWDLTRYSSSLFTICPSSPVSSLSALPLPTPPAQPSPESSSPPLLYILGGAVHMVQGSAAGSEQMLVQKLLQAERNVRFLMAKEGKDLKDCILGVIFFSSLLSDRNRKKLRSALKYYSDYLPCMWELSRMGRFMGCALEEVHYSAPLMRLEMRMNERFDKVDERFDELKALIAALRPPPPPSPLPSPAPPPPPPLTQCCSIV